MRRFVVLDEHAHVERGALFWDHIAVQQLEFGTIDGMKDNLTLVSEMSLSMQGCNTAFIRGLSLSGCSSKGRFDVVDDQLALWGSNQKGLDKDIVL